jgi:hypothetical protein
VLKHPVTAHFEKPTFLPVTRSVQPSLETGELDVVPLALSSSGSWSETNLGQLEKGQAAFDAETDLSGPVPVAAAVEKKAAPGAFLPSRLIVVGDSDFVTNAYLGLSGNSDLALNMIQWLARDERFIEIQPRQPEFKPLFLNAKQRFILLAITVALLPLGALAAGMIRAIARRQRA